MRNHWTEIEKYLEDQKIAQELIGELRDFHMRYEVEDQVKERIEKPDIFIQSLLLCETNDFSGGCSFCLTYCLFLCALF